jgi:hypothetical protein
VKSRYVRPVSDKAITGRVNRVEQIKSDYKDRRELVRSLTAADLPTPDRLSGDIIEATGRAGFFRLRGVLVGTLAHQGDALIQVLGKKRPLELAEAWKTAGIPAIAGATNWRRAEPGPATTRKRR